MFPLTKENTTKFTNTSSRIKVLTSKYSLTPFEVSSMHRFGFYTFLLATKHIIKVTKTSEGIGMFASTYLLSCFQRPSLYHKT